MFDLSPSELKLLRSLKTPSQIQNFLDALPMNFELHGETCHSVRSVLKYKTAHCMEGAMLAAAALRLQGRPPLVIDLKATKHDFDHVIAVFKEDGYLGAISKTNHAVLRYREPIYNTVRELVLSYFHEYFLPDGRKTLRSFTNPIDLSRLDRFHWMASDDDVFDIPHRLDAMKHYPILTAKQIKKLRLADAIERQAGEITEWKV